MLLETPSYYGVVVRFKSDEPFGTILEQTKESFKNAVQNLSGLRGATYYHIPETNEYCAALSFATEADVDNAIHVFGNNGRNTHREIVKAYVSSGMQLL